MNRGILLNKVWALSTQLHTEGQACAGVMIDGPKDMKPLVEAFAKQVSKPACTASPEACMTSVLFGNSTRSCMQSSLARITLSKCRYVTALCQAVTATAVPSYE